MNQSDVFDSLQLKWNLEQAILKNCESEIRADGARTLCFRDIKGIDITFDPDEMRALSAGLGELIPLGGSLVPDLLASHMLQVAIMTSHLDLKITVERLAIRQAEFLKREIETDFGLISAFSLAHSHGY